MLKAMKLICKGTEKLALLDDVKRYQFTDIKDAYENYIPITKAIKVVGTIYTTDFNVYKHKIIKDTEFVSRGVMC